MTLGFTDEEMQLYDPANDIGYKNELVELSDEQLLNNIQALQRQNNLNSQILLWIWVDVALIYGNGCLR